MQGILFSSLPYGGSITVLFSGYLEKIGKNSRESEKIEKNPSSEFPEKLIFL